MICFGKSPPGVPKFSGWGKGYISQPYEAHLKVEMKHACRFGLTILQSLIDVDLKLLCASKLKHFSLSVAFIHPIFRGKRKPTLFAVTRAPSSAFDAKHSVSEGCT